MGYAPVFVGELGSWWLRIIERPRVESRSWFSVGPVHAWSDGSPALSGVVFCAGRYGMIFGWR